MLFEKKSGMPRVTLKVKVRPSEAARGSEQGVLRNGERPTQSHAGEVGGDHAQDGEAEGIRDAEDDEADAGRLQALIFASPGNL